MELDNENKAENNNFNQNILNQIRYSKERVLLSKINSNEIKPNNYLYHSSLENSLIGFKNLGNTCYLNAALQCLTHTKELARYFLSNISKSTIFINM